MHDVAHTATTAQQQWPSAGHETNCGNSLTSHAQCDSHCDNSTATAAVSGARKLDVGWWEANVRSLIAQEDCDNLARELAMLRATGAVTGDEVESVLTFIHDSLLKATAARILRSGKATRHALETIRGRAMRTDAPWVGRLAEVWGDTRATEAWVTEWGAREGIERLLRDVVRHVEDWATLLARTGNDGKPTGDDRK